MAAEPDRVEYDVGRTVHNQRVVLIGDRQAGQVVWTLRKEAVSQRDETDSIHGLTDETLRRIGVIVAERRRG